MDSFSSSEPQVHSTQLLEILGNVGTPKNCLRSPLVKRAHFVGLAEWRRGVDSGSIEMTYKLVPG